MGQWDYSSCQAPQVKFKNIQDKKMVLRKGTLRKWEILHKFKLHQEVWKISLCPYPLEGGKVPPRPPPPKKRWKSSEKFYFKNRVIAVQEAQDLNISIITAWAQTSNKENRGVLCGTTDLKRQPGLLRTAFPPRAHARTLHQGFSKKPFRIVFWTQLQRLCFSTLDFVKMWSLSNVLLLPWIWKEV